MQADSSQWSLMTQQVQHVPGYLPWMLFGRPPLLAQCVDFACVCDMCPSGTWSTGVEIFHRPLLKVATHYRHIMPNMCSNLSICPSSFPTSLQCDPFQMAEVVQQEYVLVGGAWFNPRVNVGNTVHLSNHHSYACRVKREGAKIGLLCAI